MKSSLFSRIAAAVLAVVEAFFGRRKSPHSDPDFNPRADDMRAEETLAPTRGSLTGIARFRVSKPFGRRGRRRPMRVDMGRTSTVGRLQKVAGRWVGTPIGGNIERHANSLRDENRASEAGRTVKPSPFGALNQVLRYS